IVPVLAVPPIQRHHAAGGELLTRIGHAVDGNANRILPTSPVLATRELACLELRPLWQVVPIAELRPEPHPPLKQTHFDDPPRLATFDDPEASSVCRDRARVVPAGTLPRGGNPGFALLDHRLSRGIDAREQCIPRTPVDATLGVELGSVGLATGEARAALGAPFGELLVGLACLAPRLAALWSVGVYSVRPEKRLPPARIGVPLLSQLVEASAQSGQQFRARSWRPGAGARTFCAALPTTQDRDQSRHPSETRGALVGHVVEQALTSILEIEEAVIRPACGRELVGQFVCARDDAGRSVHAFHRVNPPIPAPSPGHPRAPPTPSRQSR